MGLGQPVDPGFEIPLRDQYCLIGPPENVRDHVMAATKSIMGGHWQEAYRYLSSLTVWNLIGGAKENVLVLLKAKLQVQNENKKGPDVSALQAAC